MVGSQFVAAAGTTTMIGAVLEGSVTVGVFVAGVAAASYSASQLKVVEKQKETYYDI